MIFRRFLLLAWALAATIPVTGAPAHAQLGLPSEGRLSAFTLAPADKSVAIAVDLLDDSDLNLRVEKVVKEALLQRGYTVSAEGGYTLTFETREIANLETGDSMGELLLSTREGVRMHMNLWSSTRDSLLSRKRSNPATQVRVLRLDMSLWDTRKEAYVWQGQALAEARSVDHFRVYRGMVPFLLDHLGDSVEQDSFSVR